MQLPPIRDTLHPPGAVQLGAVNNLRASFPPTVLFSNLDMDGTKELTIQDISQDVLRTQMTVAMKLGVRAIRQHDGRREEGGDTGRTWEGPTEVGEPLLQETRCVERQ